MLEKSVALGKRRSIGRIPNWTLALAALVIGIAVYAGSGSGQEPLVLATNKSETPDKEEKGLLDLGDEEEKDEAGEVTSDHGLGAEFDRIIAAARQGSEAAIYALEQRAESKRTKHEWLALAQVP